MTSYLNTINSEGVDLNLNSTSTYPVVIGNGLTSLGGTRSLGATTIGVITGSSATFSSTVTTSGLLTASAGFTSTSGATTLGASTIGAITGTSASFSTTLGVTGLATFAGGLTSTVGSTTLGVSTIGAITGTSASFSSTLTASNGFISTGGSTTLGSSTIGAITGTSASFSSTLTASNGFVSTVGTTTLGASTIGAITGTSATFSTTLGVTGLLSGSSATFSTTLGVTGLLTASGGLTSTAGSTTLGSTTLQANLAMGSNKITGLGAPTVSTDAATKGYVDQAIQGIDIKTSCHVATTAPLTLASDFENNDTIDGHVILTGERILVKNQAVPIENGIYIANASGAPTRASDLFTGANAAGAFVFIEKGTVNGDTGWVCTSNSGSDVVGTNNLTFVQFSSAGVTEAGTGLTKTGNTLSVNASQTQITSVGTLTSLSTGAITGTSATFSTTVGITGVLSANGGIISTLSTSSSSTTTGAITLSGGIGISNSTDATSITNGGSFTTAGGIAVAQKAFIGGDTNITSSTASTTTTNGALIVGGGSGILGNLNVGAIITTTNSTASTDSNTGSIKSSGGIGISNTTDATSSTNGGSFTTAGGVAISKKAFIGTTLDVASTTSSSGFLTRGSTNGTVSILPQASAGTYNFNLPISAGTNGQILTSSGGGSTAMVWSDAVTGGFQSFTTTGAQNQTNANVTGLLYTVGSFNIIMSVQVVATTNLTQLFNLTGVLSGSNWSMTAISLTGDDSLVDFSITAGGQIQYTSSTYTGFTSLTFTWSQYSATQGVSFLTLRGQTSGVVTVAPQAVAGTFNFNLPITSGTSGQILTSGGGGSNPMTWGAGFLNSSDTATGQFIMSISAMTSQLFSATSAGGGTLAVVSPSISTASLSESGLLFKTTPAQFDFWRSYVNLVAGTYTFRLDHVRNTNMGIISVILNSSSIGTIDGYNASLNRNLSQITGVVVENTGNFKVELQINTKHVSSSNFGFLWNSASFIRTS